MWFLTDRFPSQALFTGPYTEIWTEIQPIKILHYVNGDGPKFGKNGCGTPSSQILAWIR